MPKFFVHQNQKEEDKIIILGEDVNHIKNVLRLTRNNYIIICVIEEKNNYNSKIISIEKDKIECEIIEQLIGTTEPHIYIHLFQGLPKAEKMEWIIEKGTEIGISEFTPVNMKRCVAKLDKKNEIKKQERWQKISEMAAKQSGRDFIPKVNDIISINDILTMKDNYDIILIAYEQEKEKYKNSSYSRSRGRNR